MVCKKESRKEKTRSSSKRRGQRFSLLSKKKEDSEDEPDSKLDVTTSLIEAAVKAEDPLRGLLALQLAQVAKPRKKNGKVQKPSKKQLDGFQSEFITDNVRLGQQFFGSARKKGILKEL